MPLSESEAIILRTYPLGEGDRIVSFLSRTEGRLRGVARGARRPKSRFGASLEPLSHVRIWFFERETRPLARISQCELLESFWEAQRAYNAQVAFGLLAEISESILPEREPSDAFFRLLLATCRAVKATKQVALPLAYFALWTVRLGGWLPSLDQCARCGRSLLAQPAMESWAGGEGAGIYCRDCRPEPARNVSAEALACARTMLRESLEKLGQAGGCRAEIELANYALDWIELQAEKKLATRSMLQLARGSEL